MECFAFCQKYANRVDLARLLLDKGLRGQAVEVGVYRGDYCIPFLLRWPGIMHLVDPWYPQPKDEYVDVRNTGVLQQSGDYQHLKRCLKHHHLTARVIIHRKVSIEAVKMFKDESLDYVYIDANHSYKHALQDLRIWWPKVKRGGVLSGHDVFALGVMGVTSAIVTFCMEDVKLQARVVQGDYRDGVLVNAMSFYIDKPL